MTVDFRNFSFSVCSKTIDVIDILLSNKKILKKSVDLLFVPKSIQQIVKFQNFLLNRDGAQKGRDFYAAL